MRYQPCIFMESGDDVNWCECKEVKASACTGKDRCNYYKISRIDVSGQNGSTGAHYDESSN